MIICFPHKPAVGGPGSFQSRIEKFLTDKGFEISYKGDPKRPDLIFVVGGTRHILWLLTMKLRGVKILHRLDGINWLHRKTDVGLKKYIVSEYRNILIKFIHAFLANKIVYQSEFVKNLWIDESFRFKNNYAIIYNFTQLPPHIHSGLMENVNLSIIESNIDYSPYAVQVINHIGNRLKGIINVSLYGNFENLKNKFSLSPNINYYGFLKPHEVPKVLYNSIYFSLDINPACPNTVIEALACGSPVVAFDTGSLKELINSENGIVVPYGSDPWEIAYPDVDALCEAILKIKENYVYYSLNARRVAEARFSIEMIGQKYLDIL
jgi:glycosyltransferase involved in cell wall biosynthesis